MILSFELGVFLLLLVCVIVAHEWGHWKTAQLLGYKPSMSWRKGSLVIFFPPMPKLDHSKILLAGVVSGLLVALLSFFFVGVWAFGLVFISLFGAGYDLRLLWRYWFKFDNRKF